jgi:hypothetical protein
MPTWKPEPPNDYRITLRCLKQTFDFRLTVGKDFASLRSENSLIDRFFDQREGDEDGGQGGERIVQIRSRPCFKLTSGRTRGATWFDRTRPPQGVVWLLGAEMHDERHRGRADAYDIFGALDGKGELFPVEIDAQREDDQLAVYVGVSGRPVRGPRSGLPFPLTQERFLSRTGTSRS